MTERRYSPPDEAQLDAALDAAYAKPIDVTHMTPEMKVSALLSLVTVLDTALKIGTEFYSGERTEPFPGAAMNVMRQARHAVDLGRKAKLLP